MTEINGKGIYNGVAMGKLYFCEKPESSVKRKHIKDTKKEEERIFSAIEKAGAELDELYSKALPEVGEANAEIFKIHQMMLEDPDYIDSIKNIINSQKVNAEYAVAKTSEIFYQTFSSMEDEYMKARSSDVRDISNRLITILEGTKIKKEKFSEPYIIAADDLTPSETVQLDKEKLLGIVTFGGSPTSHTAILARTMNIPAIIGTGKIDLRYDGESAVLDGSSGTLYITPDENIINDYKKRKKADEEQNRLLEKLKGQKNITKSGREIMLYANIGRPEDTANVIYNDAGGIGLFRSEFLYLESETYPSEDKQFAAYKSVLEKMGSKRVIIRTLDIGADKKTDYFNLPSEENPAMGFRAIRICLKNKDLFKTQLRALLRASVYGRLAIMFPMITSKEEIIKIKEILTEVKNDLEKDGIEYKKDVETGIMIETPAAAVISDILAPEVDFFSIGTNDLIQYTLAADRQNAFIESYYNSHHEAVFRLIRLTAENAHKNGIWVGICGELASDQTLTEDFIKWGIDELSVAPGYILKMREKILKIE